MITQAAIEAAALVLAAVEGEPDEADRALADDVLRAAAPHIAAECERARQLAIDAGARWLHDADCNDGDTGTCGRWRAGSDTSSQFHGFHEGHVEYYRDRARGVLEAAGAV